MSSVLTYIPAGTSGAATHVVVDSGSINNQLTGSGSISNGRAMIAVTGTAVPLSASSVPSRTVVVTANPNNFKPIFVGNSSVNSGLNTETGLLLQPNEKASFDVSNVNLLYVNGQVGDTAFYASVN